MPMAVAISRMALRSGDESRISTDDGARRASEVAAASKVDLPSAGLSSALWPVSPAAKRSQRSATSLAADPPHELDAWPMSAARLDIVTSR